MKFDIPETTGKFRWQLDHRRPRRKYTCPKCGAKKHFTRYVDILTGEEAGDEYGICDNQVKCGYKQYPTTDLLPKGSELFVNSKDIKPEFDFAEDDGSGSCIPPERVIQHMRAYKNNKLFQFLSYIFTPEQALDAFVRYGIGTMDYYSWKGCCIFWQIDMNYIVRTGKIMDFYHKKNDEGVMVDCKRVKGEASKDGSPHVTFFHCREYPDFTLRQCLFGEHILNDYPEDQEVNIVESEKTAIVCYINNPKKIYLSVGGLQNIRERTISVLMDRKIIFHPDKGEAYNKWNSKVKNSLTGYNAHVSSFLEKCKDAKEGEDLADILFKEQLKKKGLI